MGISIEEAKKKFPKYYSALLSDDTNQLSEQIKISSLLVMSFECFKDCIEKYFKDFFTSEYKRNKNGILIHFSNEEYKAREKEYNTIYSEIAVRLLNSDERKKNKKPNQFKAACAFFHKHEALTNEDFIKIHHIEWIRNEITHELLKWIIDDSLPLLKKENVRLPLSLHQRVSNWWIKNIEAAAIPEDYQNFTEEDMASATVMNVQTLSSLIERALPD